jgi:hypothetical protein
MKSPPGWAAFGGLRVMKTQSRSWLRAFAAAHSATAAQDVLVVSVKNSANLEILLPGLLLGEGRREWPGPRMSRRGMIS